MKKGASRKLWQLGVHGKFREEGGMLDPASRSRGDRYGPHMIDTTITR